MRRVLSVFVVLAMVISMVPSVFAANDQVDMDELLGTLVYLDSIDEIDVTLEEGTVENTYKWTPEKVGTLSVYFYSWELPEDAEIDIVMTQGENSVTYSQCVAQDQAFELEVEAGTEVAIKVIKTSQAALEAVFYGEFVEPEGTEGNPIALFELENTVNIEGATWYQSYLDGTTMTITGKAPFTAIINGEETASVDNSVSAPVTANRWMGISFVFAIKEPGEYQINFAYPVGSDMNPAALVMGQNTAVIEAGTQGYYYTWTAEEGGKLTITMPDGDWSYQIYNLTTGVSEETQWSDSDPLMSTYEVNVFAGNEIQITVNTYNPADEFNTPAGTLTFTAAFEVAPNGPNNPIIIEPEWDDEWTSATATVTAPVGTTYYGAQGFGGMMLSIDGAEPIKLENSDYLPAVFAITNDGAEEKEYSLVFTFAPGSLSNPAQLVMGENTATIVAGSWDGYYFNWTAEADGKLTITMPAEGDWFYVVNNITADAYGDMQYSDSTPVKPSTTISVKAGDEIQVNVNNYDPNWGPTPAGDLIVIAAFEETKNNVGDLDGTGEVDSNDGLLMMRYLNGWDVEIPVEEAMDINSDGKVDSLDGLLVMRKLNGWDITLG